MSLDPFNSIPSRKRPGGREPLVRKAVSGARTGRLERRFPDCGWQVGREIVDSDLIALNREFLSQRLDELRDRFSQWSGEAIGDLADIAKASCRVREFAARGLPKDLRHFLTGEFDLETRLSSEVRRLLSTQGFRNYLCDFFESDRFYIHYPPMIRFKFAGAKASLVPLHQDSAYNTHVRDFITLWLPLSDVSEESGGVVVYGDSQRHGFMSHQQGDEAWPIRANVDVSPFERVNVGTNAGDVLLLASNLFHESARYSSESVRFSIDVRVFREPQDTTKSYYDPFRDQIVRLD